MAGQVNVERPSFLAFLNAAPKELVVDVFLAAVFLAAVVATGFLAAFLGSTPVRPAWPLRPPMPPPLVFSGISDASKEPAVIATPAGPANLAAPLPNLANLLSNLLGVFLDCGLIRSPAVSYTHLTLPTKRIV